MRAMIEIAGRQGSGPVKRREIAQAQHISLGYLENILSALKAKGLIETHRGKDGGFVLKKSTETITLLEIVSALEGSLSPVTCVEDRKKCGKSTDCLSRIVWKKMHDAQTNVLKGISLDDLLQYNVAGIREIDYSI